MKQSLPEPFVIGGITQTVSRRVGFTATWRAGTKGEPIVWLLRGDCLVAQAGSISDAGQTVMASTQFVVAAGQDQATCDASFCLERDRSGTLDPAFGEGGVIGAAPSRCAAFPSAFSRSTIKADLPIALSSKQVNQASNQKEVMPDVIGLFLRSTENAYQRRLKEVGLREAKRYGFEVLVQTSQFDSSQQVAQIREAIRNAEATKMVALLVSGVRDLELAPVAHEAAAAGLDWILLNEGAFIDELRRQYPGRALFAATCDQRGIGRLHAQQARVLAGDKRRVLCVTGQVGNIEAQLRLEGLQEGLDGEFELIELNADWTSECARLVVESWASSVSAEGDVPDVVVAQNDEMALGVRQALRDLGSQRGWLMADAPIVGCDGAESFGQRLVREGRLKATVIMPPVSGVAIEWLARARDSGELPPVRVSLAVASFPALSRLKR